MEYAILIVIVVMMFGMMFLQSRKAKQQQAERQDFRANLQPGTEIITIGGVSARSSPSIPSMKRCHRFRRFPAAFRFQCHQP